MINTIQMILKYSFSSFKLAFLPLSKFADCLKLLTFKNDLFNKFENLIIFTLTNWYIRFFENKKKHWLIFFFSFTFWIYAIFLFLFHIYSKNSELIYFHFYCYIRIWKTFSDLALLLKFPIIIFIHSFMICWILRLL